MTPTRFLMLWCYLCLNRILNLIRLIILNLNVSLYYLHNLKKVSKEDLKSNKYKYKLHYIYREFQIDFFDMDSNSLPKNASSLKFSKHDQRTMSLCLTYQVNLGLSLRKTAQALKDIHGISISHRQVANYCKTAALCIKPFVDNYDYKTDDIFTADETYIKVKGIKGYIWFIMDAVSRSIIGYQMGGTISLQITIKLYRVGEFEEHFFFHTSFDTINLILSTLFAL